MEKLVGRVTKIKKTKNNIFVIIKNNHEVQLVVKQDKYDKISKVQCGDIISCIAEMDYNNNGKFKSLIPTYILKNVDILSKKTNNSIKKYSIERLKEYSDAKNRLRNYLHDNDYIEVYVPILTDGETSSKAESFKTQHSKTGTKLFLRKTMDTFLRRLSCNDINKIYSFGSCFRNEHVTSKNMPEFEMLSIFTNYMNLNEGIILAINILNLILGKNVEIEKIEAETYSNCVIKQNKFYLITNLKNEVDSYANISKNGMTNEFKIKYNDKTIIHGVMEIEDIEEYLRKIKSQGKKESYGELYSLEEALRNGAPPCFNMGINIFRTLAICNGLAIKDYDVFAFSRLKLEKQIIH